MSGRAERALYGSPSGRGEYDLLAAGAGLSEPCRDELRRHSNLGGAVLLEQRPAPVWQLYPLPDGRWAASLHTFPGRTARGTEYRASILILQAAALDALGWDVFRLAPLLAAPGDGASPVELDLAALGAPARLEPGPAHLPSVLARLAAGAATLEVADGAAGEAAVRAVLAALPPADRSGLSFTTRFAHPRRLSLRLAAHVTADAELAARHLTEGGTPSASDAARFRQWADCLELRPPALRGLSALADPLAAAATLTALAEGDPDGLPEAGLAAVLHPANRALREAGRLRPAAAARLARARARRLLEGDDRWEASATAPLTDLGPDEAAGAAGQLDPARDPAAGLAFAALAAATGRRELASERPEALAAGLLAGADRAPRGTLALATSWLAGAPDGMAAAVAGVLRHLPRTGGGAAGLLLAAAEAAAPEEAAARRSWMERLLDAALDAAELLPPLALARLAAREALVRSIGPARLVPLVPALAERFPAALVEGIGWDELDDGPLLRGLLRACAAGLLPPEVDPRSWDAHPHPDQWELAGRTAEAAAALALDRDAAEDLAWLLWAAGHLLPACAAGGGAALGDVTVARLRGALHVLARRAPAGCCDLLVRAAVLLRAPADAAAPLPEAVLRRAVDERPERADLDGWYLGTLLRATALSRRGAAA